VWYHQPNGCDDAPAPVAAAIVCSAVAPAAVTPFVLYVLVQQVPLSQTKCEILERLTGMNTTMSTLRFIQNFDDSMTQESLIPETSSFTDQVVADSLPFPESFNFGGGGVTSGRPMSSLRDMLHGTGVSLPASSAPIVSQPVKSSGIPAMYPHCHREFNADFDSYLRIDWTKCTAVQIYDICSSPHMKSGATNSMSYVLSHAVKTLTGYLSCFCADASKKLKELVSKNSKPSEALRTAFVNCCAGTGVLESLQRCMTEYTDVKGNVVRWKAGIVVEENTSMLDTLRLASIMVDPRFVLFFCLLPFPFSHTVVGAWTCLVGWQIQGRTDSPSNFRSFEFRP
jgi:hypothetical protein